MNFPRKYGSTRRRLSIKSNTGDNLKKKNKIKKINFESERREKELHYDESNELVGDFNVFYIDPNDDNPNRTFEIIQRKFKPTLYDLYRHIGTKGSRIFKTILNMTEFVERFELKKILIQLLNLDEDNIWYDIDIYGKIEAVINRFGYLSIPFLSFYKQNNPYRYLSGDRNILLLCSRNGASLEYLFKCCRTVEDVNIVISMGADIYLSSGNVIFHHGRIMKI
jgi:hypothetical protein